jgi:MarR family transcriptional regulator, lower aerobic nicotinate degradation pathway regulator
MNYTLIKDVVVLLEDFEKNNASRSYPGNLSGFKRWIHDEMQGRSEKEITCNEPHWEFKERGRSEDSVINTLIVKMNRYAKYYVKSILKFSDFSTQDEFVYLINLTVFGEMTKMELIKKNLQDKPVGMQIINRLIKNGWIQQSDSAHDKRSRVIKITENGSNALEAQMRKIRQVSSIVGGNLTRSEKMDLIRILTKLDDFHSQIYFKDIDSSELIDKVYDTYLIRQN